MTLKEAVRKTVSYASIFDYPLSLKEIHYWLATNKQISFKKVLALSLPKLTTKEIKKRDLRLRVSQEKKDLTKKLVAGLRSFPFIWFVGLTGSVAIDNAKKNDDLDLIIITAPFTLWIIRPFVLTFFSLKGVRRKRSTPKDKVTNLICPNLWLDYASIYLKKEKHSLYTAHEVLQIYPLIDKKNTFQQLINRNSWIKKYLANAYKLKAKKSKTTRPSSLYVFFQPINLLFFLLQYLIMFPRKKKEQVSLGKAFFHSKDYSQNITKSLQ